MGDATLLEILENCPKDEVIGDNLVKAFSIINKPIYKKIVCTISGGADSDIVLDICCKCDINRKIDYVWIDTGLEYQATKEHLAYLEKEYGIEIHKERALKSISKSCKEYGLPFISKNVSEMISRLQRHGFQWEDKPYEKLLEKYCNWDEKQQNWKGCRNALAWWCDKNQSIRFNIANNQHLKAFIISNPPENYGLRISSRCCKYAKKDVIHKLVKTQGYNLNVSGVRRAEGGIRGTAYKGCFDSNNTLCDNYRPIFWYLNNTRNIYEQYYDIVHSRCYTEYGLKRTGCAGCPFSRNFEEEIMVISEFEPKLYNAINNIFGKSYEYSRKYRKFCEKK